MSFISPNSPPHRHRSSSSRHSQGHHDHDRDNSSYIRSSTSSHSRDKDGKPQYYFVREPTRGSSSHYSSSSSRARPRSGFIGRIMSKIRRILRRLYDYARRHPVKLFMLVIMPLITGGALADLLRRFGIRLPRGLEGMVSGGRRGGGYGGMGGGEGMEGVMKIARMFI